MDSILPKKIGSSHLTVKENNSGGVNLTVNFAKQAAIELAIIDHTENLSQKSNIVLNETWNIYKHMKF